MKIVKYITSVSKKLAKAESWKLNRPSERKALPAPVPAVEEKGAEDNEKVKKERGRTDVEKEVGALLDKLHVDESHKDDAQAPNDGGRSTVGEGTPARVLAVEGTQTGELKPEAPKNVRKCRALLIGIQFYEDVPPPPFGFTCPLSAEPVAAPSIPPLPLVSSSTATSLASGVPTTTKGSTTTTSVVAADLKTASASRETGQPAPLGSNPSLASIISSSTMRAKAKFMAGCGVSSPLASGKSYASVVTSSSSSKKPLQPSPSTLNAGSKLTPAPSTTGAAPAGESGTSSIKAKKKSKSRTKHKYEASTSSTTSYTLRGCHKDVEEMEKMLIDLYAYPPSSITTLVDTPYNVHAAKRDPSLSHLLPTRENIIKEIGKLVQDVEEGDRIFFFFAGHSTQEATDSQDEEDGKDELILTQDNLTIRDDELRALLVSPLPAGVRLTAVFDTCHSASLLDLAHFRCNRVYVPWINKGKRRSMTKLNVVMRKAAVPLSPRLLSPMLSPRNLSRRVSMRNGEGFGAFASAAQGRYEADMQGVLSPIFDFDRIKRVLSRKRKKEKEAMLREAEEKAAREARERALALEEDDEIDETMAIADTSNDEVNLRRKAARQRRERIIPPPQFDGWVKSSLDRMWVGRGSGDSVREALPSTVATGEPTPLLPASVLQGEGAQLPAQRRKIKLPPIRTTSLHEEVPTQPVTPQDQPQHVTFTPQTYTPQSSVPLVGLLQQSLDHRHHLEEHAKRKRSGTDGTDLTHRTNQTNLTNRTDDTHKSDMTDATFKSDISDDSGVFWLCSEPEDGFSLEDEDVNLHPSPFLPEGQPSSSTPSGPAEGPSSEGGGSALTASAVSVVQPQENATTGAATSTGQQKRRYPRRCLSPQERFCTGWCREPFEKQWGEKKPKVGPTRHNGRKSAVTEGKDGQETADDRVKKVMPFVISLSAAKDSQQAFEDATGASMTTHLVTRLRGQPRPTLAALLGGISHDLHASYLPFHEASRLYRKKAREANKKREKDGKKTKEVLKMEMDNFQDPQISSLWPLDMGREVWDP